MKPVDKSTKITSFPAEILDQVFNELDRDNLKKARQVCRVFRDAVNGNQTFRSVISNEIKEKLRFATLNPDDQFTVLLELGKIDPRCFDEAEKLQKVNFKNEVIYKLNLLLLILSEGPVHSRNAKERAALLPHPHDQCLILLEIESTRETPDLTRVEKMVNLIQDPNEKDEVLSKMAAIQARTDLQKALQIVGHVSEQRKSTTYLDIVEERSMVNVEEALALLDLIPEEAHQAVALLHFVALFARTDFTRALELADEFVDPVFKFKAYLELAKVNPAYLVQLRQMVAEQPDKDQAEFEIAKIAHAENPAQALPAAEKLDPSFKDEVVAKIAEKQAEQDPSQAVQTACGIQNLYIRAQAMVKIAQLRFNFPKIEERLKVILG